MEREYYRSKLTNELYDKLIKDRGVGIILSVPGLGEVRLRGDSAREFLWTLRSHKSSILIDRWLDELRERVNSVHYKENLNNPSDQEAIEGE